MTDTTGRTCPSQGRSSFLTPSVCRVHTLAFPVVQELADMYKAVDAPATVNLLAKLAVEKSYHAKLDDTRSSLAVSCMLPVGHLSCPTRVMPLSWKGYIIP